MAMKFGQNDWAELVMTRGALFWQQKVDTSSSAPRVPMAMATTIYLSSKLIKQASNNGKTPMAVFTMNTAM